MMNDAKDKSNNRKQPELYNNETFINYQECFNKNGWQNK